MSKLVEFSDGTFGLRKGVWLFGYEFQDFKSNGLFWRIGSQYFNDCKTTKEKAVSFRYKAVSFSYKVIKE